MQPRDNLILEFWDRSRELNIGNKNYRDFINKFFSVLLESDIKNGDLASDSLVKKNKIVSAFIIAKEDGILAGIEEFKFLNRDLDIKQLKNDGDNVKRGEILLKLDGNALKILQRERTNLNLLQRMSGIATLANSLSKKAGNVKIAATRKTLWGLLDKKAVSAGGGLTHRLSLNDGVIIKDNHLSLMNCDFKKAINSTKKKSKYIEMEVESKKQALKAAYAIKKTVKKNDKNFYAIMLDNINPANIKWIIKNLKNNNLYDCILLEASGNINESNLKEYSGCGADIVSMGCITNSAKALDISQEIR